MHRFSHSCTQALMCFDTCKAKIDCFSHLNICLLQQVCVSNVYTVGTPPLFKFSNKYDKHVHEGDYFCSIKVILTTGPI